MSISDKLATDAELAAKETAEALYYGDLSIDELETQTLSRFPELSLTIAEHLYKLEVEGASWSFSHQIAQRHQHDVSIKEQSHMDELYRKYCNQELPYCSTSPFEALRLLRAQKEEIQLGNIDALLSQPFWLNEPDAQHAICQLINRG